MPKYSKKMKDPEYFSLISFIIENLQNMMKKN